MRDTDKLECNYMRVVATMKGNKAIGYKDQFMTLMSFMLKKRRLMENMNMITKYVKCCHMKEGLDFLFMTLKSPKTC